jgi:crotonobetainyl-CoA hydratase
MDTNYIKYEKQGRIGIITLNRPQALNSIHPPALAELVAIWADFRDDPNLWVAVVTGAGEKAFCVGADLKYRAENEDVTTLRKSESHPQYGPIGCFKPVIAAVNGYALGGGLELALGCDIIIASRKASFGLPEARRGLLADAGGVITLPRRIPYHQAMAMILTGKLFTAEEACTMGLVNEVVTEEDLLPAATRWAEEMLECAPLSLRAAKQVVLNTIDLPRDKAEKMMERLSWVREMRASEDYVEGPKAFAEKRKPKWTGK